MFSCINKENIYLLRDNDLKFNYFQIFQCVLDIIKYHATPTQFRKIESDLQLAGYRFNEAKYLQAACECSVAASIALAYENTFQYEPKLNHHSSTNVDCCFSTSGYKFNIEVKCPDYTKYHELKNEDCYSVGYMGRLDNHLELFESVKCLFNDEKPVKKQLHMDNKLKDYLISCQKKFSSSTSEYELNILLVCCDSEMDMQKWIHYLYGNKGLLTVASFLNPELYSSVDVVIITNLYHKHYRYWEKDKLSNHWSLGNSFNLIFKNQSISRNKEDAISFLIDIFPNYSIEFSKFSLKEHEEVTRVPRFVKYLREKTDNYLFQPYM